MLQVKKYHLFDPIDALQNAFVSLTRSPSFCQTTPYSSNRIESVRGTSIPCSPFTEIENYFHNKWTDILSKFPLKVCKFMFQCWERAAMGEYSNLGGVSLLWNCSDFKERERKKTFPQLTSRFKKNVYHLLLENTLQIPKYWKSKKECCCVSTLVNTIMAVISQGRNDSWVVCFLFLGRSKWLRSTLLCFGEERFFGSWSHWYSWQLPVSGSITT